MTGRFGRARDRVGRVDDDVFGSASAAAKSSIMRVNTPAAPQHFQRLWSVSCGPGTLGAACVALGKERLQPLHLLIGQSVQVAHARLLAGSESHRIPHINGS